MAERLLDIKNLAVSFMTATGEVKAVRGIDLHLDRDETLAIVGESGCGKSVSIQTVMRLNSEPPAAIRSGEILYHENGRTVDIVKLTDQQMQNYRGRAFSMIFQDAMTSLNPTTKVGKQLVEAICRHQQVTKAEAKAKTIELFARVGLPNPETVFDRYPHTLSGGQRQRVMIALALSCDPNILFADEPTTALDVTVQSQILSLMNEIRTQRHMGIIFITHNLGVVARMADRVAVMYAGQIVESGRSGDIFYRPQHPYTWGLLRSVPDLKMDLSERLVGIPGTPPDLFSPPKGCGFAARCPYAMNACMDHIPGVYDVAEGHRCRCFLYDPRCTQKVTPPVGRDNLKTKEVRTNG